MPFPFGLLVLATVGVVAVIGLVLGSIAVSRTRSVVTPTRPKFVTSDNSIILSSDSTQEAGSIASNADLSATYDNTFTLSFLRSPVSFVVSPVQSFAQPDALKISVQSVVNNDVTLRVRSTAVVPAGKLFFYQVSY